MVVSTGRRAKPDFRRHNMNYIHRGRYLNSQILSLARRLERSIDEPGIYRSMFLYPLMLSVR